MCIPCTIIFLSQQSCYFAAFCSSWPQLLPGVRSCLSLKYLFLFQNHACTNCTYIQHIYIYMFYNSLMLFCCFPQVGKSCSQGWDPVYFKNICFAFKSQQGCYLAVLLKFARVVTSGKIRFMFRISISVPNFTYSLEYID